MSGTYTFACPDGRTRDITPRWLDVEEPKYGPLAAFPKVRGWHVLLGVTCQAGSYYCTYDITAPNGRDDDETLMHWGPCLHSIIAFWRAQRPRGADEIVTQVMIRRHRTRYTTPAVKAAPPGTPEASFTDQGETILPVDMTEPSKDGPDLGMFVDDSWIPKDIT